MSMISSEITSSINLTNRNAFELLEILSNTPEAIYIEKLNEARMANAQSLLGLLSLDIRCKDVIVLHFDDSTSLALQNRIMEFFQYNK